MSGQNNSSECVKIHAKLNQLAKEIVGIYSKIKETNIEGNDELKNKLEILHVQFEKTFYNLHVRSYEDKYLWQYCTCEVYKSNFDKKKEEFLKRGFDRNEYDFVTRELRFCHFNIDKKTTILYDKELNSHKMKIDWSYFRYWFSQKTEDFFQIDFISLELMEQLNFTQTKKIKFLNSELVRIQKQTVLISTEEEQDINIDYSHNTYVERIVFLHELGILEYLRDIPLFNGSINKLAEIVSTFSGIEQETIYPIINPIYSKKVKKKSPLSPDKLKSVHEKLMKIGYILPKNT
jgi:hypothetical protein